MYVKSYLSKSVWFKFPAYIVGAPGNKVGFNLSIVFNTSFGLNFGIRIIFDPCIIDIFMTVVIPYTWKNGSTPKTISDRKSTRLNSSHVAISYAVFCLKKKK